MENIHSLLTLRIHSELGLVGQPWRMRQNCKIQESLGCIATLYSKKSNKWANRLESWEQVECSALNKTLVLPTLSLREHTRRRDRKNVSIRWWMMERRTHCLQGMTWLWHSWAHSSCSYWNRVFARLKLSMLNLWWRKGLKGLTSLRTPIGSRGMLEERSRFQQFLVKQWVTPHPCTCWLLWVNPVFLPQGKDKIKRHVGGMAMFWEEVEEVWMSREKEKRAWVIWPDVLYMYRVVKE